MSFGAEDICINDNINSLVKEVDAEIHNITIQVLESKLDKDSKQVTITMAGYVARKFSGHSKCYECKRKLITKENQIYYDDYLNELSLVALLF